MTKPTPGRWRPMNFTAHSILGIGRRVKTETRRLVQPPPERPFSHIYHHEPDGEDAGDWWTFGDNTGRTWRPRYKPGERVYCNEAIRITNATTTTHIYFSKGLKVPNIGSTRRVVRVSFTYLADRARRVRTIPAECWEPPKGWPPTTRTPPYVPRWAARYGLLIKAARAEHLQAITPAGAEAEGIAVMGGVLRTEATDRARAAGITHPYVAAYFAAWQAIHAKPRPWAAWGLNPVVWVYTFEYIEDRLALEAKPRKG